VILIHQRHRQTDGRRAISILRYALVHRAVKNTHNLLISDCDGAQSDRMSRETEVVAADAVDVLVRAESLFDDVVQMAIDAANGSALYYLLNYLVTCQILRLKCTKFDFGWGSAPEPAGIAYDASPDPLAGLKGAFSKCGPHDFEPPVSIVPLPLTFAVQLIFSILLHNHISNASVFSISVLDIVQVSRPHFTPDCPDIFM